MHTDTIKIEYHRKSPIFKKKNVIKSCLLKNWDYWNHKKKEIKIECLNAVCVVKILYLSFFPL